MSLVDGERRRAGRVDALLKCAGRLGPVVPVRCLLRHLSGCSFCGSEQLSSGKLDRTQSAGDVGVRPSGSCRRHLTVPAIAEPRTSENGRSLQPHLAALTALRRT